MKTALIVILALIVIGGGIYAYNASTPGRENDINIGIDNTACTMDAKLCPDGSYVGRTGPNCEFAACPSGNATLTGTTTATTSRAMTGTVISKDTSVELPKTLTVTYTSSGFAPKTAIIAKGGTVTFINKSTDDLRVASDPHPLHNGYPGFDAKRNYSRDGVWSFTFDKVGSWTYHNHLAPTVRGTIIVQ
jgi:plastocyanin